MPRITPGHRAYVLPAIDGWHLTSASLNCWSCSFDSCLQFLTRLYRHRLHNPLRIDFWWRNVTFNGARSHTSDLYRKVRRRQK